jgi:sugar phosphate permease
MGLAVCLLWILFAPRAFTDFKGDTSVTAAFIVKEDHLPDGVLNRNLILISILNIMVGFSSFSSQGMYPTFLKTHLGFDPTTTAWCASMYGIGSFLGLPAGYLGDKLNQKWVVFVAVFIAMCSGFSMYNLATRPGMQAVLSFMVGGFGTGCLFPNVYALTQRSVKRAFLGRASGIASSLHYGPALMAGGFFAWLVSHVGWGKGAVVTWLFCPLISLTCILLFDYKLTSKLVKNPVAKSSASA